MVLTKGKFYGFPLWKVFSSDDYPERICCSLCHVMHRGCDLTKVLPHGDPCGLEPLNAFREMWHRDSVFSYFLLRRGKDWPWQDIGIQTQGGI
jgi:hypothetical protein